MNPFPKTEDQKELYWKTFDSQRWGFLGWGINRVQSALKSQAQPVIDAMERTGSISAGMGVLESIPRQPMEKAFQDLYGKVGAYFAGQVYQSFKSYAPTMQTKQEESDFMRFMRDWIQVQGVARIQGITGTTRRRLRLFLEQSIEDGLGAEEAARLLSEQQGIVGLQRARVIARTEIISASNRGSLHGAEQTNLDLEKEWISTRDGRTRRIPEDKTDHFTIDGQTVGLKEPFQVPHIERGTEGIMYPGDPTGSPENVIMCRCVVGYQRKS